MVAVIGLFRLRSSLEGVFGRPRRRLRRPIQASVNTFRFNVISTIPLLFSISSISLSLPHFFCSPPSPIFYLSSFTSVVLHPSLALPFAFRSLTLSPTLFHFLHLSLTHPNFSSFLFSVLFLSTIPFSLSFDPLPLRLRFSVPFAYPTSLILYFLSLLSHSPFPVVPLPNSPISLLFSIFHSSTSSSVLFSSPSLLSLLPFSISLFHFL